MTESNDEITTPATVLPETTANEASADATAPAPRARRNTRRTPRKPIDDKTIIYDTAVVTPKAPRAPRKRAAVSAPFAEPETPHEQTLFPQGYESKREESAPAHASALSDEIAPPVIRVPARTVEPEVPARYSSDDDNAPSAPAPIERANEERPDTQEYSERSSLAEQRRYERRRARISRQDDVLPVSQSDERQQPDAGGHDRNTDDNRRNYDDSDSRDNNNGNEEDRHDERPSDANDDRRDDNTENHRDERDENDGERDNFEDRNDSDDESGAHSAEGSNESDDSEHGEGERKDSGDEQRHEGQGSERPREGDQGRYQNRGYNNNQQGGYRNDRGNGNGGGYGNYNNQQGGYNDRRLSKRQKFKQKKMQGQGGQGQPRPVYGNGGYRNDQQPQPQTHQAPYQPAYQPQPQPQRQPVPVRRARNEFYAREDNAFVEIGDLPELEALRDVETMDKLALEHQGGGETIDLCQLLTANIHELMNRARTEFNIPLEGMPVRAQIVEQVLNAAWELKRPISVEGIIEVAQDGYGLIVYQHENYRVRPLASFVPRVTMKRFGLKRGHIVKAFIQPPRKELTLDGNKENCPAVLKVETIMGKEPMANLKTVPFEDLTPYYPTERFLLETSPDVKWDNTSMRVVDLLTPVGKGQRGLIVAPPRTGKTILQQGIANAIMKNNPEVHLIVLLVDERPEEVTDFRRQITAGEVIASTFDEVAESHVHAAEMVIEKARRMVEAGTHVVILLDSITRLARAYNALAGNSGKILSGGVEATAMQKPKRFFGSARNIEGGGSLTILGTALVETGSRMDEVIFEEFKGTGNMELVLDRALVDKRIFPSINLEKSGTRKEELLYHPEEMIKVYGLRRAMKGVPSPDAMEMLITRVKKTKTNIEFLMGLNR